MTAQLTRAQQTELKRMRPPYRCVCGQPITTEDPMIAAVRNQNGQSRGETRLVSIHKEICPFVDTYNVVVECLGRLSELRDDK